MHYTPVVFQVVFPYEGVALAPLAPQPRTSRSLTRWALLARADAHSNNTDNGQPSRNRRATRETTAGSFFTPSPHRAFSPLPSPRASDDTTQCMACGIPRSALRLPSSLSWHSGGSNPFFVIGPVGLSGGDQGAVDGHASTWRYTPLDKHMTEAYTATSGEVGRAVLTLSTNPAGAALLPLFRPPRSRL